ncbi:hypothetical protein GCM10011404_34330 [Sphingomonas prati]|nr:hypothetical protein GCM10011404_34330 [Sphingomonas prati]
MAKTSSGTIPGLSVPKDAVSDCSMPQAEPFACACKAGLLRETAAGEWRSLAAHLVWDQGVMQI